MVSLELDEVMNVSDRILVMYEGEIVADVDPKKVTTEELGLYMAGAKRSVNNENKKKNIFQGEGIASFGSSILAIICGLLFGLIILLASNPSQAYGGFMMILQGDLQTVFRELDRCCITQLPLL